MTNNTRSPQEIEREIEDQRSSLTTNLEGLFDKFSLDSVIRQVGDQFREHGGDLGRNVAEKARANPIPLALTGLGLAWMLFGNSKSSAARSNDGFPTSERGRQGSPAQMDHQSSALGYPASRGYEPHSWAKDDAEDSAGIAERLSEGAAAVKTKAAEGAAATKAAAASATGTVADAADHVKDRLMAAGGRIAEGTEELSQEGRKRVIAARQNAIALRRKAAVSARRGTETASDFYDQQPLVVGALALAVGAAIGGALPRTRSEDDLMGAQSDALFDQAERIFHEEKAKARSVAQSVQDEVKDIAAETKADLDSGAPGDKSAVEAIGDQAKSVAGRVADKAKSSAKSENLGKPKV